MLTELYVHYLGRSAGDDFDPMFGNLFQIYRLAPAVMEFLVREAMATGKARIPAATLSERVDYLTRLGGRDRQRLFGDADVHTVRVVIASCGLVVKFCETAERSTGKPAIVIANHD